MLYNAIWPGSSFQYSFPKDLWDSWLFLLGSIQWPNVPIKFYLNQLFFEFDKFGNRFFMRILWTGRGCVDWLTVSQKTKKLHLTGSLFIVNTKFKSNDRIKWVQKLIYQMKFRELEGKLLSVIFHRWHPTNNTKIQQKHLVLENTYKNLMNPKVSYNQQKMNEYR
jgi:hypothetical protein